MLGVMDYGGIYAKICALKSQLLTKEDYTRLSLCEDVKKLIDLLGEKESYKESAEEAIAHGTNRVAIEASIFSALCRDYAAIHSFLTKENHRRYLDVIFIRHEAGFLKRLLRSIFDRRDIQNVMTKSDYFISKRMKVDTEKLKACSTFEELMEAIKDTEFFDVLAKVNSDTGTLFDYEMQLDFYCFMKIERYQKKLLDKTDCLSQRHIYGTEADLLNIMWIHRAKTYYQIDGDRIFSCIIPLNYRLRTDEVKALVASEHGEFLEILGKTHYRNAFTGDSAKEMDRGRDICMNRLHNLERKKNPYSISSITWYLHYKTQELKNVTTLTECVRYKLSSSVSMKKLNLGLNKEGDDFD